MTTPAAFDHRASPLAERERFTAEDVEALLYGLDRTPRVVAAEFRAPNRILLYQRTDDGQTILLERTFRPWLIARDPDALRNLRPAPRNSCRCAPAMPISSIGRSASS